MQSFTPRGASSARRFDAAVERPFDAAVRRTRRARDCSTAFVIMLRVRRHQLSCLCGRRARRARAAGSPAGSCSQFVLYVAAGGRRGRAC
ncbi:MAG: hypothetical protein MZW92_38755 [Comamonadaceae bacterium]|nr:hypothetical protein [Comamonadaceae bacterium]